MLNNYKVFTVFTRLLFLALFLFGVILFLPWTQNIRSKGYITTLQPNQRPQTINSIIGGRIEKWFVNEGNYVKQGDTILFLSETKEKFFDPNLLQNTENQIKSKELAVDAYMDKVKALDKQIDALLSTKNLKIEQAKNYVKQARLKIVSDSINLISAENDFFIANNQLERTEKLKEEGLKSLTELEIKRQKSQETEAKKISAENKLLESKNKLINARIELSNIENLYRDKLSKAESDKFSSLSKMYDAEALVTKMQNQYMNYSVRNNMYYVTSPQDGYITKTIRSGIGETIKEGEEIVSIMPAKYDLAVAMYVKPMNLPLLSIGQPVRFMFDGWPSIVFSGWPNMSYGTFGGEVVAIDNFISPNGKYRMLVKPNPNEKPWPKELRVGSGANGIALLKDVPIWYELWRNLNGFPQDYYQTEEKKKKK
jgi:multidrug resistance efflux pump